MLRNGLRLRDRSADYQSASPFRHVVLDDFLETAVAAELADRFPSADEPFWYRYDNAIEKKLACNLREHMPAAISRLIDFLNSSEVVAEIGRLTGIEDLQADPTLHGGGMHCIRAGGRLDVHLDYSIHPHLELERRVNIIVYLNRDWPAAWGGDLELWDAQMNRCVRRIAPLFNRAVVFDTGDRSFHGHPEPLACPAHRARQSVALYYLSPARPGATQRFRARFVRRPTDPDDPEVEELRRLRSGLDTGPMTYRGKPSG
jgi:Rps23 Pro-64 3,4-dihydroxylase Tpa1-like proline 4-hydroxylase